MYDIHMHLVPDVDDGAWDIAMSLEMLRIAKHEGIRSVIATPHGSAFRHAPEHAQRMFRRLQQAAEESDLGIPIYSGCEVRCGTRYMTAVLRLLDCGQYPTLNHTRYVLTEFSTGISPAEAEYCLNLLLEEGYLPVIAHAERYPLLGREPDLYASLRSGHCRIQCNLYSFAQEPNPQTRHTARALAERQLVDFLGSDAHRTNHRPPRAARGLAYLRDHCSEEYFRRITEDHPRKLLNMI